MHLNKVILYPQRYPDAGSYPFNLNILQKTEGILFSSPVTFFAGENGTGKSTLLKAICRKCGIHIWEDAERIRYGSNPYEEDLHNYIDVQWLNGSVPGSFFGSQIFHDFARFLDGWARATPAILDYFGGNSLLSQSHGESLISFFSTIYKVKGLHFLDEPETALSPKSQLKLLKTLKKMGDAGHAQFVIATHSPILLACPGAVIYSFDNIPIKQISYEDTEYFRVYRDFINNRDKYLERL
jgi:predicted ATPase